MARLFFALWPDAQAGAALAAAARRVASEAGGRAVPAAKLHLTLVFLGEVRPERLAALRRAAGRVAGPPFEVTLERVGGFARAGVAWAGTRQPAPGLLRLQAALADALGEEGFAREARDYAPHLTLARRIARVPDAALPAPVRWRVRDFALVESRGAEGYATLAQWPLGVTGGETKPPGA